MNRFPHLCQKLFNTPLAIHPHKAEIVMAALADRLGVTQLLRQGPEGVVVLSPELEDDIEQTPASWRPYCVEEGVAIIPVEGTLVQKSGSLRPWSGMTGYDGIRTCFLDALNDPEIRAIALQIDSPGGEVAGCFDLADTIFAARGVKPIWAILDECAYSGAYAIASAADRIVVPRTGGAGSIGVIVMHSDLSAALTKAGIKVTIIQFGARKADGNEFEPLADEARTRFQAQIDTIGEVFVSTVARNRKLSANAVRGTEAATFLSADAKKLGLVDDIAAPDAAFAELLASL
jgi:signal peptide peptidase SppA